jgi:putative ABC transport system permease protein
MFKNYFKTSLRFLARNKSFSIINISGLAVGTLCCLYILLYVQDQFSFDKHHQDAKDIYRITTRNTMRGDVNNMATCSPPIAPALKKDFPEVLEYARTIPTLDASIHLMRYKEKSFYEKDVLLVDSTFFDIFNYHFDAGSPADALKAFQAIVLTRPIAEKLFGREDPVGKTIQMDDANGRNNFTVTGVVDERMGKTHIEASMFIRMTPNGFGGDFLNNHTWSGNNFTNSYIKIRPDADVASLEKKLPAFLQKYGGDQLKALGMEKVLHLQPITAIHTSSEFQSESAKNVSRAFLYILMLIAALIQIIACINFMNLSTARASKRAKEVGVRKVVGAERKDLLKQFLSESFLLALISVLIALPLLFIALPLINQITNANISFYQLGNFKVVVLLAAIVSVTGILAGSYPAIYLSAFQAIKVIKGNFTNSVSVSGIRKSLVVFQFVLSIVLISSIIIIYSQLNFIKNQDLGFDQNQKLIFSFHTDSSKNKMKLFLNELEQLSEVKTGTIANNFPGQESYHDWIVYLPGQTLAQGIDQQNLSCGENFVKTTGIQLLSGRDFQLHDSSKVLINETLMKRLGLTLHNAPGSRLLDGGQTPFEIAGVVKDFNYKSLRDEVKPFMILYQPTRDDLSDIIVSVSSSDYKSLIGKIEKIWNSVLPAEPFSYSFLDEQIQKQYETEITLSNIINSFTLMAILISCLGLFGLAAFSAEQRMKEIGVRKVLGATVPGIVQLLSKDFLKLVLIAIVIATPVSWWMMNKWLQAFSYRVPIVWWMFALAGMVAIIIAMVTVSFQTIKAAVANPIKSLRIE